MALYVSLATRRRRAIVAVAVAALVAFGAGLLVGRQQVPSIDDRVGDVRDKAAEIATGIERLDIEYEQVLAGTDTATSGVVEPLDELRVSLIADLDDAPWIATSTRSSLLDSLAAVESAVKAEASLDDVRALLADAADGVRGVFGVT
ncbi:MAG: hypothetical protein AB7L17_07565 [Ilumatobacteraceae bacterium]